MNNSNDLQYNPIFDDPQFRKNLNSREKRIKAYWQLSYEFNMEGLKTSSVGDALAITCHCAVTSEPNSIDRKRMEELESKIISHGHRNKKRANSSAQDNVVNLFNKELDA